MKKVYISYCTEHEFGQRPDGSIISDDLKTINDIIEENSGAGNREQYWTYTTPMEVWCNKKTFEKIMERKQRTANQKIVYYNNNDKLKLYKLI